MSLQLNNRFQNLNYMLLNIKCLNDSTKELYEKHSSFHKGDSGLDVFFQEDQVIKPKETVFIKLGISAEAFDVKDRIKITRVKTQSMTSYWLMPRSSISKTPLRMSNSIGLIDAEYRGELIVSVDNISNEPYEIKKGQRLFQIVNPKLQEIKMKLISELSNTTRGTGGFGSTGK